MNIVIFIFVMLAIFNSWNISTVLQDRANEENGKGNTNDAKYFANQSVIWGTSAWIIAGIYSVIMLIAANVT